MKSNLLKKSVKINGFRSSNHLSTANELQRYNPLAKQNEDQGPEIILTK